MADTPEMPAVCFVALKAYPALSGAADLRHIGGAEVQQVLIARGLLERGYRVSFVTLDHGQADSVACGGITVYTAYGERQGWPGLRFFHPRATGLWSAMKRCDADIYYQRTSDSVTGLVAMLCRRRNRRFVFGVGAHADTTRELEDCPTLRERKLYLYGLRRADRVVAQTRNQQQALREVFGIESVVIPNAVACESGAGPGRAIGRAGQARPSVLWAGRFSAEKRLDWLVELARRCPQVDFDVLGDGPDDSANRQMKADARGIANLRLHGFVPSGEMGAYYDLAAALVCTSSREGFPNTFLEAWSRGVPVVTTFDPDGVVARCGLGIHAESMPALAEAVRKICFDGEARSRFSQAAYDHVRRHHTVETAVSAYCGLFEGLASGGRGNPREGSSERD